MPDALLTATRPVPPCAPLDWIAVGRAMFAVTVGLPNAFCLILGERIRESHTDFRGQNWHLCESRHS